jgi:hypothetical protein
MSNYKKQRAQKVEFLNCQFYQIVRCFDEAIVEEVQRNYSDARKSYKKALAEIEKVKIIILYQTLMYTLVYKSRFLNMIVVYVIICLIWSILKPIWPIDIIGWCYHSVYGISFSLTQTKMITLSGTCCNDSKWIITIFLYFNIELK